MNLYIDESGSFVSTSTVNSWCLVGCYATSVNDYNRAQAILRNLKKEAGFNKNTEIKLPALSEDTYFKFLVQLNGLGSTFHTVATDLSSNTKDEIRAHQNSQAARVSENIDKMNYEEGRQHLNFLRERIQQFPEQLYLQLFCQIGLMHKTVSTIIPYYIQRDPQSLSHFRWRIDPKNITKTIFEEMFEILSPMILETRSFSDPLIMIEGYDYSVLKKYEIAKNEVPKYYKEVYGIDVGPGLRIHKIIRDDMDFPNSKSEPGVQIADLLVSGLRKCLRLEFKNNDRIALALGGLMVQAKHNNSPIELIRITPRESSVHPEAEKLITEIRISKVLYFGPEVYDETCGESKGIRTSSLASLGPTRGRVAAG